MLHIICIHLKLLRLPAESHKTPILKREKVVCISKFKLSDTFLTSRWYDATKLYLQTIFCVLIAYFDISNMSFYFNVRRGLILWRLAWTLMTKNLSHCLSSIYVDSPSITPHGYVRPRTFFPFTSIIVLLPTTANGTLAWNEARVVCVLVGRLWIPTSVLSQLWYSSYMFNIIKFNNKYNDSQRKNLLFNVTCII